MDPNYTENNASFSLPASLEGRKGGEIDENGYVGKKRKPPKRLNPSNNGSAKRSAASYRRKLVKGPDGTPVPKDALFYFPQYGEKDMTRPYECHRCVRLFSLEFDLKQVCSLL